MSGFRSPIFVSAAMAMLTSFASGVYIVEQRSKNILAPDEPQTHNWPCARETNIVTAANALPPTRPAPKFAAEWQPFIPYADEKNCPAHLQLALDKLKQRMGMLPNSMGLYLHHPAILGTILAMGSGILTSPESTLSRVLKNKLGVICSSTNGCVYCTTHQCTFLTRDRGLQAEGFGVALEEARDLIAGTAPGVNDFERVCFDYARTASRDSASVDDALRARMKAHLSPAQIIELACVVGYWKFINTVHDSLNLPVEAVNLEATGYIDAWRHNL